MYEVTFRTQVFDRDRVDILAQVSGPAMRLPPLGAPRAAGRALGRRGGGGTGQPVSAWL